MLWLVAFDPILNRIFTLLLLQLLWLIHTKTEYSKTEYSLYYQATNALVGAFDPQEVFCVT